MRRQLLRLFAFTCWAGVLLAAVVLAEDEARIALVAVTVAFGAGWLPLTPGARDVTWRTYGVRGTALALAAAVIVGIDQISYDSDLTDGAAFLVGFAFAGAAGLVGVVVGLAVMAVRRRIETG